MGRRAVDKQRSERNLQTRGTGWPVNIRQSRLGIVLVLVLLLVLDGSEDEKENEDEDGSGFAECLRPRALRIICKPLAVKPLHLIYLGAILFRHSL